MVNQNSLLGVFRFADNTLPTVINGSLWTLSVEFLYYVSVAIVGSLRLMGTGESIAATVFCTVIGATFATLLLEARFSTHFEMVTVF